MAGASAGALLLAVYALTLAPSVTFWDAGEFIAAAHGLGIPHPPGTPLYVAAARAWSALLPFRTAIETNLFSAVLTAAAGAIMAGLIARWLGRAAFGLAAAMCAGAMMSVWASATETEVYAASLLLSVAMLAAAERAGRPLVGRETRAAPIALLGFLMALAPAVHLSALVAAPAAIVLAVRSHNGVTRWPEAAALSATLLLVAGIGTGRVSLIIAALVAMLVLLVVRSSARPTIPALLGATALATTALLILLVRATHDPALNQGDPSTLGALIDVVARRQYAIAPLWPRQAPIWLQVANLFEYADWQIALGLSPGVQPSLARTPFTILFAILGAVGCERHFALHRRSWLATAVLLGCASLGVVIYLNLKAGPSIGYGFLPDDAAREPRERDYFFALAFFTWGIWAGIGAVVASYRFARGRLWPGVALAGLPIALNWSAVDRGREPEASIPRALAVEMLASVPDRGILFVWGDNDTYPLWYLQQAEGVRPDVTVVTIPLLGAGWYRDEMHRRDSLLTATEVGRWRGEMEEVAAVARSARLRGRPVAVAVTVPAGYLEEISAPSWVLHGVAHVAGRDDAADRTGVVRIGRYPVDTLAAAASAARVSPLLIAPRPSDVIEPTPWAMRWILACPGVALGAARGEVSADSLDLRCNRR